MKRHTEFWMKETGFQNKALHGDAGYHYMGSFYTFYGIGKALGEAILDFDKQKELTMKMHGFVRYGVVVAMLLAMLLTMIVTRAGLFRRSEAASQTIKEKKQSRQSKSTAKKQTRAQAGLDKTRKRRTAKDEAAQERAEKRRLKEKAELDKAIQKRNKQEEAAQERVAKKQTRKNKKIDSSTVTALKKLSDCQINKVCKLTTEDFMAVMYAPISKKDIDKDLSRDLKSFEDARELYYKGEWEIALEQFEKSNLKLCDEFINRIHQGKPEQWSGIWSMTTK